jgi:hypothetical protein
MRRGVLAFVATLNTMGVMACGGGAVPTIPSGTGASDVVALEVSCPALLLIGQRGPCLAVARLRSGQAPLVSGAPMHFRSAVTPLVNMPLHGAMMSRHGMMGPFADHVQPSAFRAIGFGESVQVG